MDETKYHMIEKRLNKIINDNSELLKNGIYYYSKDRKQAALLDSKTMPTYSNIKKGPVRKIKMFIRNILFNNKISIHSTNKTFDGNTILIPSNNYGVKIFSDTEVLTKYNTKLDAKNNLNNKTIISKYYDTPNTLKASELIIIEDRIIPDNTKRIDITKLFDSMERMLTSESIKTSKPKSTSNKLIKAYFSKVEKSILSKRAIQHGDLWTGNIIKTNKKLIIIDYENVAERFFLYDYFHIIYTEYYLKGDRSYINDYLNGRHNSFLNKAFIKSGLAFNPNKLENYLNSFLYEYYNNKFEKNNAFDTLIELTKLTKNRKWKMQ